MVLFCSVYNFFQRHTVLWWVLTHGLGYGTVIIPGVLGLSIDVDHDVFWASIYTAVSRAVFAFAIGWGILGTTNGIGGKKRFIYLSIYKVLKFKLSLYVFFLGIVKKILEWRPLYVLGRLSYSAYLVHIPLILLKSAIVRYPLYVNEYFIVSVIFMRNILHNLITII